MNAIEKLNGIIQKLQKQHHAIVLMLDTNQSLSDCYKGNTL
jgi:hypothetical protein